MGERGAGDRGSAEVDLQEDSGRVQGVFSDRDSALARVNANPSEAIRQIGSWKDQPFAEELALAIVNVAGYESDWCDDPTPGYWATALLRSFSQWSDAPWAEKVMLQAVRSVETRHVLESMSSWASASFAGKVCHVLINRIAGFDDEDTLDAFDQDPAGGNSDERYVAHVSGVSTRDIGALLGCLYESEVKEQLWVLDLLRYLVTRIPGSVHEVRNFIRKFTDSPSWMDDSFMALLSETGRRNTIRSVHDQHSMDVPSFEAGSPYALRGDCPNLRVLEGDFPEPDQLIRIGGIVREFPSEGRLARNGGERCALSTDKDRMVGPGQVQKYCRGALMACRIFRAGSAEKALSRQPGLNRSPAESRVFHY